MQTELRNANQDESASVPLEQLNSFVKFGNKVAGKFADGMTA